MARQPNQPFSVSSWRGTLYSGMMAEPECGGFGNAHQRILLCDHGNLGWFTGFSSRETNKMMIMMMMSIVLFIHRPIPVFSQHDVGSRSQNTWSIYLRVKIPDHCLMHSCFRSAYRIFFGGMHTNQLIRSIAFRSSLSLFIMSTMSSVRNNKVRIEFTYSWEILMAILINATRFVVFFHLQSTNPKNPDLWCQNSDFSEADDHDTMVQPWHVPWCHGTVEKRKWKMKKPKLE